jgi:hypothetical protein
MDKVTETLITTIAERAASNAIAKVCEFHHDDLKVLRERMDIGFEKVGRDIQEVNTRIDGVEVQLGNVEVRLGNVEVRLDGMDQRFDCIENTLSTLLGEFKADKEKQKELEAKVAELTERVRVLEMQLAHQ